MAVRKQRKPEMTHEETRSLDRAAIRLMYEDGAGIVEAYRLALEATNSPARRTG
jgi:hypothetical protein